MLAINTKNHFAHNRWYTKSFSWFLIGHARSQIDVHPISAHEKDVNDKMCEIILNIHLHKEYVCPLRVERELFERYGVRSFHQLRVYRRNLNALVNLHHYNHDIKFYMQVFGQIFNLCTLHELGPLLAKFLKVETYDDVRLGPLDEHPDVQRVFEYKPAKRHQPIPVITSADIINAFLEFQELNRGSRTNYEAFLDSLVEKYELRRREELGIYCRSFPYLTEVC